MKQHPLRWVAKYLDGTRLNQFDLKQEWVDENRLHRFNEVEVKKLYKICVENFSEKEICCLNISKEQIIIGKENYKLKAYLEDNEIRNYKIYPQYNYHFVDEKPFEDPKTKEPAKLVSYNLEFKYDLYSVYNSKIATVSIVAAISSNNGYLQNEIKMFLDAQSLTDSLIKLKVERNNDSAVFEINSAINKQTQFDLIELEM